MVFIKIIFLRFWQRINRFRHFFYIFKNSIQFEYKKKKKGDDFRDC